MIPTFIVQKILGKYLGVVYVPFTAQSILGEMYPKFKAGMQDLAYSGYDLSRDFYGLYKEIRKLPEDVEFVKLRSGKVSDLINKIYFEVMNRRNYESIQEAFK